MSIESDLDELLKYIDTMYKALQVKNTALRAVLLFHTSRVWTDATDNVWRDFTGTEYDTITNLCKVVKEALDA